MSADYQGSVEEVHRAFHEESYWLGRLAETPVDIATLDSMRIGGESGDDGTVAVITEQTVLNQNLPALVTQLLRGDLCVRREETWTPIRDGAATASIAASIVGAPVNVRGTAVLAPAESAGCRMSVRLEVQVRVPFIGGKLERLIGQQLAELINIEQRYTTEWIAKSA